MSLPSLGPPARRGNATRTAMRERTIRFIASPFKCRITAGGRAGARPKAKSLNRKRETQPRGSYGEHLPEGWKEAGVGMGAEGSNVGPALSRPDINRWAG